MDREQIAAVLQQAHLFRGADRSDLECVAEIVDVVSAPPGQHIFFHGDIATEFFVLAGGKVRIYIPGRGGELDLGIVEDGQMFGEGGLVRRRTSGRVGDRARAIDHPADPSR